MKESYRAQNSMELKKLSSRSSHYSMQNKELSHPKKKMDIKVDYVQLPAGLSLWWISRILKQPQLFKRKLIQTTLEKNGPP